MCRLRKASARLCVVSNVSHAHGTLNTAGADTACIRTIDREDCKSNVRTTHDDTIHAYTCCREGKTRQDTIHVCGELQPSSIGWDG